MNRRMYVIFSLLILSIFCIGAVSALNSVDAAPNPENITIDGINFQIPAGFEEDVALALNNEESSTSGVSYVTNGKTFSSGNEVISIGVAVYDGYEVDDTIASVVGGDELSINGVDGYDYSDNEFSGFVYAKDGKLIIISVTNADLLEEVVVDK